MINHVRDRIENMKKRQTLSTKSRQIWKGQIDFLGMKNIVSKIKKQKLKIRLKYD